jgi:hypothetical protein
MSLKLEVKAGKIYQSIKEIIFNKDPSLNRVDKTVVDCIMAQRGLIVEEEFVIIITKVDK